VGSCVGFGIGGNITSLAKRTGTYTEWFSPEWIYNGARFIEGDLSDDAGCMPVDAFQWLLKNGCLLEHFWPYDGFEAKAPPSSDEPMAAQWPILSNVVVDGGATGICSALAAGNMVSIGTPWFDKWMEPGPTGVLANVTADDVVDGGHETLAYGYDLTHNVFFIQNSWGKEWAKDGLCIMPMNALKVFKQLGGYDANYPTVNWKPSPGPTPPPPTVSRMIQVSESLDGGKTWTVVSQVNIK
jgi:hypothetical protein